MTSWYCPLPFRHAFIDSRGIAACCQTPRYPTTLDQWVTHPELKKLQQQLLDNEQPLQCEGCVKSEKIQGRSLRTDANKDYNHEIFHDTKIDFVDFRSFNICNFKCRSCFPVFSHGISQESNKYPELQKFFNSTIESKTVSVSDQNVEWIINNLGDLKKIMFTGGEPTIIPGVKELIKKIRQDHKHIMIMITSNASFEDDFWFEITDNLPNLHWTVSVDAIGSAAEIVRHGTDWNVIEKNITWLAQHAQSLDINSVVSNLTVFGLQPLLTFGRRMQLLSIGPQGRHGDQGCRHQFTVCQRPYYLCADNWPDELKFRALTYLQECLNLDLDKEQRNMISGLLSQITNATFDQDLWDRTQSYNQVLNSIRNENHTDLYQEQI
jgi:organic radical activating enzyme